MKRIISILGALLIVLGTIIGQDVTWDVKAIAKKGDLLPVRAIFEDGSQINVVAVLKDGATHFMDVKVIKDGKVLPVKLLVSNDFYVPVKAIMNGKIISIKAVAADGSFLDVKGVSRAGNTVKIAAISPDDEFFPVKAVSPDGYSRDVSGVKFTAENMETMIGDIPVMAHVKALPVVEISGVNSIWYVKAIDESGSDLAIVATNTKGAEYPVQALMIGKSAQLLNVKAKATVEIDIKILKTDGLLTVMAIDEYGRIMEVKAKTGTGEYYQVVAGELKGNIISIKALTSDGKLLPVKAISSGGHVFDVKGIKVLDSDVEGIIEGLRDKIKYFAHVKALPSIK